MSVANQEGNGKGAGKAAPRAELIASKFSCRDVNRTSDVPTLRTGTSASATTFSNTSAIAQIAQGDIAASAAPLRTKPRTTADVWAFGAPRAVAHHFARACRLRRLACTCFARVSCIFDTVCRHNVSSPSQFSAWPTAVALSGSSSWRS